MSHLDGEPAPASLDDVQDPAFLDLHAAFMDGAAAASPGRPWSHPLRTASWPAPNHRKIVMLAERLGGLAVTRPAEPSSRMIRLVGKSVIDLVFEMSGVESFESVRSRSVSALD